MTCIEEDKLQLRHETSPEATTALQAGLLLKEHHRRGISGAPSGLYHTPSTYKRSGTSVLCRDYLTRRLSLPFCHTSLCLSLLSLLALISSCMADETAILVLQLIVRVTFFFCHKTHLASILRLDLPDWISGEELSRSFSKTGVANKTPVQVSETEEVTLTIMKLPSSGAPSPAMASPTSASATQSAPTAIPLSPSSKAVASAPAASAVTSPRKEKKERKSRKDVKQVPELVAPMVVQPDVQGEEEKKADDLQPKAVTTPKRSPKSGDSARKEVRIGGELEIRKESKSSGDRSPKGEDGGAVKSGSDAARKEVRISEDGDGERREKKEKKSHTHLHLHHSKKHSHNSSVRTSLSSLLTSLFSFHFSLSLFLSLLSSLSLLRLSHNRRLTRVNRPIHPRAPSRPKRPRLPKRQSRPARRRRSAMRRFRLSLWQLQSL